MRRNEQFAGERVILFQLGNTAAANGCSERTKEYNEV